MSDFDDAMSIMGFGGVTDTKSEDKGVWSQLKNQITIYDEYVEIHSELLWDDSLDEFSIVRCAVLRNADIVPKVIIRNNRKERQPVIGPKTNDNLSYGRYELPRGTFNKFIIDNCDVTLETEAVDNFTIGEYGSEKVPEIELIGDAILNCPETTGKRMMKVGPEPLQGSTKHSRSCQYIIWTASSCAEDFLSDEMKEYRREMDKLNPDMSNFVGLHTLENRMKSALELLRIKSDLDVSKLLIHDYNYRNSGIIMGCIVLGLSEDCCNASNEIFYEILRWKELAERYNIKYNEEKRDAFISTSKAIMKQLFKGRKFDSLTAWEKRVIYELIPVYEFNFSGKSVEECAEEWWNNVM